MSKGIDVLDNYKTQLTIKTKAEIIRDYVVTPEDVEQREVEYIGGTHQQDMKGCDGIIVNPLSKFAWRLHLTEGDAIEVKTQRFHDRYKLYGRGKFSMPSVSLYKDKLARNEAIIVLGYCPYTGVVFYRFGFRFSAISSLYKQYTEKKCTCDFSLKHYANHDSFVIDYIAPISILKQNQDKFRNNFYNYLVDLHKNNLSPIPFNTQKIRLT